MWAMSWPKRAIDWIENGTAYVSVPFTWELPQAYSRCAFLEAEGYKVRAGGPAVDLMPDYLADVAQIGGSVNALPHHNPMATVTMRGCIRKCGFCAVPLIEGDLVELPKWEPKPIVQDNNLLACSDAHFDRVIDSLKPMKGVDFNSGLDARLLTKYHAERLAELEMAIIRLAWDDTRLEPYVMRAIERLNKVGFHERKIRVYVLIGYNDSPEDARYRLDTLMKHNVWPYPMRYNPLDALKRDTYVDEGLGWTDRELHRYIRFWSRQQYFKGIPFDQFEG